MGAIVDGGFTGIFGTLPEDTRQLVYRAWSLDAQPDQAGADLRCLIVPSVGAEVTSDCGQPSSTESFTLRPKLRAKEPRRRAAATQSASACSHAPRP